ncbi:unnamed protein product [Closterium sp. NIES-54]
MWALFNAPMSGARASGRVRPAGRLGRRSIAASAVLRMPGWQSMDQPGTLCYVNVISDEGIGYSCMPGADGIAAPSPSASESVAALGASASAVTGASESTASTEALHTFTLDSGASRCFFLDCTTVTLLHQSQSHWPTPLGSPVVTRASTVLLSSAVSSSSLSGLHLPLFSTNLVSTSGQFAASCSCRVLSHQTLLWPHRLSHPSLPRLRSMHSRLLVSGLPRSMLPLECLLAPQCLPCVEGRQRAAPLPSSFPPTTPPLQTLHMDVWGPALVSGTDQERYFLLFVDDYMRYTTVFPLRSKAAVSGVLIPWIRATCHKHASGKATITPSSSCQPRSLAHYRCRVNLRMVRPTAAIVTMVDPVANAGIADTLETRLADARKRHADGEYGTIPLLIVELGIRSQWATEHPSRLGLPCGYNLVKRMMMVPGKRESLDEDSITSYILQDEAIQEAEKPTELFPQVNYAAPTKLNQQQGQRRKPSGGGRSKKDVDEKWSTRDKGRGGGGQWRECWICHDPDHLSYECPDRDDSDEDDTKGGRCRSASRHPRRDAKPRKEKQTPKKTSSTKDVDNSSGKSRGDGDASCLMVDAVTSTGDGRGDLGGGRASEQPPLVQPPLEQPPLDPEQPPLAPGAAALGPREATPGPWSSRPWPLEQPPLVQPPLAPGVAIPGPRDAAPGPDAAASLCCPLPPVAARCCSPPPLLRLPAARAAVERRVWGWRPSDAAAPVARGSVAPAARLSRGASYSCSPEVRLRVETTKSSAKHKVTTGLDITLSIGADPPCVSCVRGKLAQHTFPDKGSDAEEALAVVHIDLCGPFRVIAKDGSLFFLLLKDRHTRFVWVMPVAKKSDVLREFQKWLVLVERQAKKLVLMLRSDRGGEFLGKEFSDFVDGKGIVHDLACPYTPQQNGMAEREMRIVVKSVRTMLLHMDVQHHWWHLALRQADWVRNCLERSTTPPETSPYQLLTGKKPDLTLARVWGCMVQFMVLEQQRGGKLAPKARWGVHLGVLPDSKGWEVLDLVKIPTTRPLGSSGGLLTDLTDNKVVTSVEVIFYKTLSLEVWKVKFGPASGRTQAHLPMDTSTATVPLLAEIDEPADQDVVEVLPPPPVLAPPFPVADQPASTPMSATSDEGSLKASPVAPASGIAGGQQGVKLIDQDGKPSTTEEQQTGEPVEQEATAGLQSTGELPKSAGGEESTDSAPPPPPTVEVPITKPELQRTGQARRPPERLSFHACLPPATFSFVYDEVDDDLLYDNAEEDEELPELDRDMHADPEHRWDIATMTVKEALASWKGEAVKAAMEEEIHSLIGMGTWELVKRPCGVNIMKNQWVCGADYDETYSPVSSYVTLRIFLSIVAVLDLNLMQLDMKNAFLQSKLDRVLYMYQPDYFDDGTGQVCKLLKSLYELKQSPLLWYRALDGVLEGAGWKKSQVDEALYFKASNNGMTCWVLVYVDDLLAASSSLAMLKKLKDLLEDAFELREISPVVKYLGLEIVRDRPARKLWLHQQGYADKLRRRFINEEQGGRVLKTPFAATTTRPDIVFACSKLGSGLTARSDQHWREVERCLAYLADTRDTALEFGSGPESLELIGYVDADDAGDKKKRTSTSGHVFVYGGAAVSWSSSRIKCTTLSSTESEYVAATNASKEGRRLRFLLA